VLQQNPALQQAPNTIVLQLAVPQVDPNDTKCPP
jgi:hypothetical protein